MSRELDLAGQVVELVRQAGGPEAQAEAYVSRLDLALTRFANSAIHQNVAESTTRVRLRVHVDGRTTVASTTLTTPDGLRDLVDRTLSVARSAPRDPAWPGLAPPAAVPAHDKTWDDATADASPEERAAQVKAFVTAAEGFATAGYCRTAARYAALANTAGQSASGRSTDAAIDGVARGDGAAGAARLAAVRLAGLDGARLGARAAAKARASAAPVELPPQEYEVILEPAAVADLLQNLAWFGFNGKAYQEQRSFVELGAEQFDPAITLVDDPVADPALPFDIEGTPRRVLPLVERGVTRAVAHDRRTAAQTGTDSTGHAAEGRMLAGPIPVNLRLLPAEPEGGEAADAPALGGITDADTAALVASVRRGLLVTDLWYTRVLDPKTLVVTGLTRNGVWLVENGEITKAVRDLRFTQSYPRALAPGAVLGIGHRLVRQPDSWDAAWWSAPSVRLAGWNFTGGASG